MVESLKSCPFCGGEAAFGSVTYGDKTVAEQRWPQATFHKVNCIECGSDNVGIVGHHTAHEAAKHWNTRAASTPAPVADGLITGLIQDAIDCLHPDVADDTVERFERDCLRKKFTARLSASPANVPETKEVQSSDGGTRQCVGVAARQGPKLDGPNKSAAPSDVIQMAIAHEINDAMNALVDEGAEFSTTLIAAKVATLPTIKRAIDALAIAEPRPTNPPAAQVGAGVREALRDLVSQLHKVHQHPAYKAVWELHQVHQGQYCGPNYEKEFKSANVLLSTEPLYDADAAAVRALDWQEVFADRGDGSQDNRGWEADSGFGCWYSIEQYFASDSYGWQVTFDYGVIGDFDDPDQAKACAQRHFAKRIVAALSSQPVAAAGVDAPLVRRMDEIDAARIGHDWLNAIAASLPKHPSNNITQAKVGNDGFMFTLWHKDHVQAAVVTVRDDANFTQLLRYRPAAPVADKSLREDGHD